MHSALSKYQTLRASPKLDWLGDNRLEWAVIAVSPECLILFTLGASAILIAQFLLPGITATDSAAMAIGGLLIAAAHFRNHRLCNHKHSNKC